MSLFLCCFYRYFTGSFIIETLDAQLSTLDDEITKRLSDEEDIIEALDEITGVGKRSAQVIISEIGTDMSHFPTAENLASWAGVCPGNNESASKKKAVKPEKVMPL